MSAVIRSPALERLQQALTEIRAAMEMLDREAVEIDPSAKDLAQSYVRAGRMATAAWEKYFYDSLTRKPAPPRRDA